METAVLDPICGIPIRMQLGIARIHAGCLFTASHDFNSTTGMILLKTPADKFIHCDYGVDAYEPGRLQFFEAPTISAEGTELTLFNHKRMNTNTIGLEAFHTPTVTADGTELPSNTIGSNGVPGHSVGGSGENRNRYILKQDTYYLMRYTASVSGLFTLYSCVHEAEGNRDE